jgi:hypothetical protein
MTVVLFSKYESPPVPPTPEPTVPPAPTTTVYVPGVTAMTLFAYAPPPPPPPP